MNDKELLKYYIDEMYKKYKDLKESVKKYETLHRNHKLYIKDLEKLKVMISGNMTYKNFLYVKSRFDVYNGYILRICEENNIDNDFPCFKDDDVYFFDKQDTIKFIFDEIILLLKGKKNLSKNIDILKTRMNIYKRIIKLYNEGSLYDHDEEAEFLGNQIKYGKHIKCLNEDQKDILSDYVFDCYTAHRIEKEIKRQEKEEKEKAMKQKLEQERHNQSENKITSTKQQEKEKDSYNILDEEEQDFISTISDIIYTNDINFRYINEYHESIVKYNYEELMELEYDITFDEYIKYNLDIIYRDINSILQEIKKIKDESKKYMPESEEMKILIEMKNECIEELNVLSLRLDNYKLNTTSTNDKSHKRKIVYLLNDYSEKTTIKNIKLIDCIYDTPQEYYLSFLNLLERLENNDKTNIKSKGGKYTNNKKKSSLYKVKNFKTRIIYKILSNDVILVIMGLYKKNLYAAYENELISLVYSQNKDIINKLISDLENSEKRDSIIEEHNKLTQELKNYLINNSRGHKNNKMKIKQNQ